MRNTVQKAKHKKPTSKNKFLIEGFEWFDKINGNSYHRVIITDINTNEVIIKSLLVYGYGDQYRQTAYNMLLELGLVEQADQHNHELNRGRFLFRKIENCLKREVLNL